MDSDPVDKFRAQLLTIEEAAAYLRCSTKHVRRQVKAGRLAASRVNGGRLLFQESDLVGLLTPARPVAISHLTTPLSPTTEAPLQDSESAWIAGLMSHGR